MGLLAGFRDKRDASKETPAVVRRGNLALIKAVVVGFEKEVLEVVEGKRRERALGKRRNPGQESSVGKPHSSKILVSSSTSFFPCKRGSRVKSSPKMQPTDHMSISGP